VAKTKVADPPPTTTTTSFGFTLAIGSAPNQVEIPLSVTLPPPATGSSYEYTNPNMVFSPGPGHIPNPGASSKPSPFVLQVGAFLSWVTSALSGGALGPGDLPTSLQNMSVGVDYLLVSTSSTQTTIELSVTLLSGTPPDQFATFTPVAGLSLSAQNPYLSVAYNKAS